MADFSSALHEQNKNQEGRVETQRRRPMITLMDSVLRTPLKDSKRIRQNSATPSTPPSTRPDNKRKFRSVSSSLNENTDHEAFGTRFSRPRPGTGVRSPFVRHTYSEPPYPRSHAAHDVISTYRRVKRPRTEDEENQLEYGMDKLHLEEVDEHICGPSTCQRLMSRLKGCLDLERKARQAAEENHLAEMQKRLEMERLVDNLRERLNRSR